MKELCRSSYEKETTKQEFHFLKQQIDFYNSPSQSLECSSIARSPLLDSIEDPALRQELSKRYREVAEQTRAQMFSLYVSTVSSEMEQ